MSKFSTTSYVKNSGISLAEKASPTWSREMAKVVLALPLLTWG
jgi:hypothetical protein